MPPSATSTSLPVAQIRPPEYLAQLLPRLSPWPVSAWCVAAAQRRPVRRLLQGIVTGHRNLVRNGRLLTRAPPAGKAPPTRIRAFACQIWSVSPSHTQRRLRSFSSNASPDLREKCIFVIII